jgi:hypothetical protein
MMAFLGLKFDEERKVRSKVKRSLPRRELEIVEITPSRRVVCQENFRVETVFHENLRVDTIFHENRRV